MRYSSKIQNSTTLTNHKKKKKKVSTIVQNLLHIYFFQLHLANLINKSVDRTVLLVVIVTVFNNGEPQAQEGHKATKNKGGIIEVDMH